MEAHDERDTLRDAYEEALDLAAYLRKAIAERDAMVVKASKKRLMARVAELEREVQAGRYVSVAENVIESDEDYARRLGWERVGSAWYQSPWFAVKRPNGWDMIRDGITWLWYPTLREALNKHREMSLAQALAEVGEDDPA